MDAQLLVICALTFVIHLIGTLAYAARIAGVRTRRIAISFSLAGSRLAGTLLAQLIFVPAAMLIVSVARII